ncbi:O-acetyl-ADP-ribose deacetylase (Regulator of RNase III), contains Macro domain [Candidatus Hydrogenisulfobacillus filiaventi]|uniref:O-acetyl-ADP-ribose deacetylase (Regulator of RNase III), contains Macro domain n=1 Tax=Candidatus Hydrogenisulfobacillus filiaventi TaxID=2707344 RepID=A0A6F8ZK35_9FIRM|nr:macro domain-containing protein [Bacillota bacterium]CAB1130043.1 O-acetyl-ADP-ribose deacetylase (Regulator of RNase III), contains Macro domain [Candidatus Hydrogenisulfobacillus filiaventi]
MRWRVLEGDITEVAADAIVNAANPGLSGGGGVDGAIHRLAGPALTLACRELGGCPVGDARITPGFRLPARYVIHAVGPVWRGGTAGEARLLASAYRQALLLADHHQLVTVAFPAISTGAYGYPLREALAVGSAALAGAAARLHAVQEVLLVAYTPAVRSLWTHILGGESGRF